MTDQENVKRFIFLRSEGWSYNRIAVDLNVSKPTLIKWGRQHQFEIQNLRATITEGLIGKHFKPQHERFQHLAQWLERVEQELAQRKLDTVPTPRLLSLAASLRAEIARESKVPPFSPAHLAVSPPVSNHFQKRKMLSNLNPSANSKLTSQGSMEQIPLRTLARTVTRARGQDALSTSATSGVITSLYKAGLRGNLA